MFNPQLGTYVQQAPRTPLMTQLSAEDLAAIKAAPKAGFTLVIPPLELKRCKCTHKLGQSFDTRENPDGTVTCQSCGETFNPELVTVAEIQEKITDLVGIMQAAKLVYLDMPKSLQDEFVPIIEMIKKIPQFYEMAVGCWRSYDTTSHLAPYGNSNMYVNGYAALTGINMMNNPMLMQQQQMMQQQMQQQQGFMPQQGFQMPQFQQPAANPFYGNMGGGDPMLAQQMMMQQQMMQNQMQQPVAAPTYAPQTAQPATGAELHTQNIMGA